MSIDSLDDPRIAVFQNVRDRDLLGRRGFFMAEGRLVVRALLGSQRFATHAVLLNEAAYQAMGDELSAAGDAPVYVTSKLLLESIVGFPMHRGCLAAGVRGEAPSVDEVLDRALARSLERRGCIGHGAQAGLCVAVLEGILNHDNVGGLFRSAAGLGIDAILLDEDSVDPLYRKALRVSMGAVLSVPFARAPRRAIRAALRARGVPTVAMSPSSDAAPLSTALLPIAQAGRAAFVLGEEGPGLSEESMVEADRVARIPIQGIDSLNVAVAGAIAFYAWREARELARPAEAGPQRGPAET